MLLGTEWTHWQCQFNCISTWCWRKILDIHIRWFHLQNLVNRKWWTTENDSSSIIRSDSLSEDFLTKLLRISLIFLGVAVRFNPSEPTKFLIMEKSGTTRIFSTSTFAPVTSFSPNYSSQDPALDAEWSFCNPTHVATALGARIQHWNLNSLRFFF